MYTEKMSIEITNIPKEKFDKLRDDISRVIFKSELSINDEKTGYVGDFISGNTCGIDLAIKDK